MGKVKAYLPDGTRLREYEIERLVATGGMGAVYRAHKSDTGKLVAIKEVNLHVAGAEEQERALKNAMALKREFELVKNFNSSVKSIVRYTDGFEVREARADIDIDGYYVVMDFLTGESLDEVLNNYGAMPEELAVEAGRQMCDALDYLHTPQNRKDDHKPQIVFRDMKPSNVKFTTLDDFIKNGRFVNCDDKDLVRKASFVLFDFGVASEAVNGKGKKGRAGTRGFMPPEASEPGYEANPLFDIYSLGVTLYNLVTGSMSPTKETGEYRITDRNPKLSTGLEKIILRCTSKDPSKRYQSCAELRKALERYREYDEETIRRNKRRLSGVIIPLVLSIVCLIGGVVGKGLYDHRNSEDYDNYISDAKKAAAAEDAGSSEEAYNAAIACDGLDIRAYEGLIDLYKEDGAFDTDERDNLLRQTTGNMDLIKAESADDYLQLNYDIGTLYWIYYNYGDTDDNRATRMKNAKPWFDDIQAFCEEKQHNFSKLEWVKIFCSIADFYVNYTINVTEGEEQGTYRELWDTLVELKDYLEDDSTQDRFTWEGYKEIVYALENQMKHFKSDGVEKSEVEAMVNDVRVATTELEATTETTEYIKDYISERLAENGGIDRSIASNFGS